MRRDIGPRGLKCRVWCRVVVNRACWTALPFRLVVALPLAIVNGLVRIGRVFIDREEFGWKDMCMSGVRRTRDLDT